MNGSSISHTPRDVSAVHVWAATRVSMSFWSAVLYGWVYFKVAVARFARSFFQVWLCLYLNPSLSFIFPSVCNKSNYTRLKRPWQTYCVSSLLYSTKALKPIDIPMGLTERALTLHDNNFYSSRCVYFSSVLWCFVFPSHRNIVMIWQGTESSLEDQIWKFHKFKFRFKIIWLMFRFKLILKDPCLKSTVLLNTELMCNINTSFLLTIWLYNTRWWTSHSFNFSTGSSVFRHHTTHASAWGPAVQGGPSGTRFLPMGIENRHFFGPVHNWVNTRLW